MLSEIDWLIYRKAVDFPLFPQLLFSSEIEAWIKQTKAVKEENTGAFYGLTGSRYLNEAINTISS